VPLTKKKEDSLVRYSIFLYVVVAAVFLTGTSYAFEDGDFQYWSTGSISGKLAENWKIKLEEEFRFGDNAKDWYYTHTDAGITYSGLADWLDVGANFRLVLEENSSDDWEYENRPHGNIILKYTYEGFKFSNRARLEYRDKDQGDDSFRYRNKFSLKFPFKATKLEIQPYVADEIFYDFDKEDLNRNRLYAGVGCKLFKNLKADLYYVWQASKSSDTWKDTHALGTKLKFSF